ncbi:hypothetical protein [Burkholderia metallica]|uniref:hypothetical protein n=1 Tax=Burkholderia metallica TaxID=488729 RepID=UPI001CF4FD0C|nr:hypothetical protein [Burkholderia metallica]MCA7999237.1 hypothetical protein [Burkholderia metallica]
MNAGLTDAAARRSSSTAARRRAASRTDATHNTASILKIDAFFSRAFRLTDVVIRI